MPTPITRGQLEKLNAMRHDLTPEQLTELDEVNKRASAFNSHRELYEHVQAKGYQPGDDPESLVRSYVELTGFGGQERGFDIEGPGNVPNLGTNAPRIVQPTSFEQLTTGYFGKAMRAEEAEEQVLGKLKELFGPQPVEEYLSLPAGERAEIAVDKENEKRSFGRQTRKPDGTNEPRLNMPGADYTPFAKDEQDLKPDDVQGVAGAVKTEIDEQMAQSPGYVFQWAQSFLTPEQEVMADAIASSDDPGSVMEMYGPQLEELSKHPETWRAFQTAVFSLEPELDRNFWERQMGVFGMAERRMREFGRFAKNMGTDVLHIGEKESEAAAKLGYDVRKMTDYEKLTDLGTFQEGVLAVEGITADMLAIGAVSSVPYVGQAVALTYTFGSFENRMEETLRFEHGVPKGQARLIAGVAAVPYALSEYYQVKHLHPANWGKGAMDDAAKLFTGVQNNPNIYMHYFGQYFKRGVWKELKEEYIQAGIEFAAMESARVYADSQGIEFTDNLQALVTDAVQATMYMPFVTALGGGIMGGADAAIHRDPSRLIAPEFKQAMHDKFVPAAAWDSAQGARKRFNEMMASGEFNVEDFPAALKQQVRALDGGQQSEDGEQTDAEATLIQKVKDAGYINDPAEVIESIRQRNEFDDVVGELTQEEVAIYKDQMERQLGQADETDVLTSPKLSLVESMMDSYGGRLGVNLKVYTTQAEALAAHPELEAGKGQKIKAALLADRSMVVVEENITNAADGVEQVAHEMFGHRGLDLNPKAGALFTELKKTLDLDFIRSELPAFYRTQSDDSVLEEYLVRLTAKAAKGEELGGEQASSAWNKFKEWAGRELGLTPDAAMRAQDVARLAKDVLSFSKGYNAQYPDGTAVKFNRREYSRKGGQWVNDNGQAVKDAGIVSELESIADEQLQKQTAKERTERKKQVEQEIQQMIDQDPVLSMVEQEGGIQMPKLKPGDSHPDEYAAIPPRFRGKNGKGLPLDEMTDQVAALSGEQADYSSDELRATLQDADEKFERMLAAAERGETFQPLEGNIPILGKISDPAFDAFLDAKFSVSEYGGMDVLRDESGQPITVYHGTLAEPFEQFKPNGGGIFFTDNPEISADYSRKKGPWMTRNITGSRTIPANLTMSNPLEIDANGQRHDNIPVPWADWKQKSFGNLPAGAVSVADAAVYARENGYDGLIVRNVIDSFDTQERIKSAVYAVFKPEQVQSVFQGLEEKVPMSGNPRFSIAPPPDSEAFKAWFGDSKVVDADGKPLVVYHGTKDVITSFDPEFGGKNTGAKSAQQAFFFTDKQSVAETYAQSAKAPAFYSSRDALSKRFDELGNIENRTVEQQAEIEQVSDDLLKMYRRSPQDSVMSVYISMKNPLVVDYTGKTYGDDPLTPHIEKAKAGGYDGVVFKNIYDANRNWMGVEGRSDVYAAFTSTQIKSATGNNGTFDANNPDIRFSVEQLISQLDEAGLMDRILNSRFIHTKKFPDNQFWRGEDSGGGAGTAQYGLGYYSTTDKSLAEDFTREDGKVFKVDAENIPSNPLWFATHMDFENWLDYEILKPTGIRGKRAFGALYPDLGRLVVALGFDGLAVGTGKEIEAVKYPKEIDPNFQSLENEVGGTSARFSMEQQEDTYQETAVHVAGRIFAGNFQFKELKKGRGRNKSVQMIQRPEKEQVAEVAKLLKDQGASGKLAAEVLAAANEIALNVSKDRDRLTDNRQVSRAIRDEGVRQQFRAMARQAHKKGMEGGQYFEMGKARVEERIRQAAEAAMRTRPGLMIEDLEEVYGIRVRDLLDQLELDEKREKRKTEDGRPKTEEPEPLEDLSGNPDLSAGEQEIYQEPADVYLFKVKSAVVRSLLKEGAIDDAGSLPKNLKNPIVRAEYIETLKHVLLKTSNELMYGFERDVIEREIRRMDELKLMSSVDKKAEKLIQRMFDQRVRETKEELYQRAKTELDGFKGRIKSRMQDVNRKVTGRIEKMFNAAGKALRMPAEAAEKKLMMLNDRVQSLAGRAYEGDPDAQVEFEDALDELNAYMRFAAFRYKTTAEMAEQLDWLQNTMADEMQKQEERREALRKETKGLLDKILPTLPNRKQGRPGAAYFSQFLEQKLEAISRFGKDGERQAAQKELKALGFDLARSNFRKHQGVAADNRAFGEALAGIYGVSGPQTLRPTRIQQVLHDLSRLRDEYAQFSLDGVRMSKAHLLQLVGSLAQEDIRAAAKVQQELLPLVDGKEGSTEEIAKSLWQDPDSAIKYTTRGGHGLTAGVLEHFVRTIQDGARMAKRLDMEQAILKELTAEDMKLLNWFRDYYRGNRPALSEVNKEVAGLQIVAPDVYYIPIKRDIEKGLKGVNVAMPVVPPSLAIRTFNARDLDETASIVDLYMQRLESNQTYIHFAKQHQRIARLFNNGELLKAMRNTHGKKFVDELLEHLRDVISAQPISGSGSDKARHVTNFFAATRLGFNVSLMPRQVTSLPAFAMYVSGGDFLKYSGAAFTKDGIDAMKIILASPHAKTRLRVGNTQMLNQMLSEMDPKGKALGITEIYQRLGTLPTKLGDIVPTLIFGSGYYRAMLQDASRQGMREEEAQEWAMDQLWRLVEMSQQSGLMVNLARWQRSGGPAFKLLGQFISTPQQFASKEFHDISDLAAAIETEGWDSERARKAALQAAKSVGIGGILLSFLYGGTKLLWNALLGDIPDDDDWRRFMADVLSGPFSGIVIFGTVIEAAISGALIGERGYGNTLVPAAGIVSDAQTLGAMLYHLLNDPEKAFSDLDALLRSNQALYRDVSKVWKNYTD